jgi:hypothetical protein
MLKHQGRIGISASTSPNPRTIEEDISFKIKEVAPESVPILTITSKIAKGKSPINHKIQVAQMATFDDFDYISASGGGTGGLERYGRITLDQLSREPGTGMYYYPQDRLFILATGQEVEVVITEDAALKEQGAEITLSSAIVTGTGTTQVSRSNPGEVVVKTVQPVAFRAFSSGSDCIYQGRTIHEGQSVEGPSRRRDVQFDFNYVEHKEANLVFTKTQTEMYKSKLAVSDFDMQQKETIREFKQAIEKVLVFGQRAWDTQSRYAKPSMGGFVDAIKTNVAHYTPSTITNYEDLIQNFLADQAFRWNPNGTNKIGLCGFQFLRNFSNAFREFRRTTSLKVTEEAGMNLDTYVIPGGLKIALARTEVFRQGTPLENWLMTIDPSAAELRVKKDFETKDVTQTDERLVRWMMEWQGSIAFHNEQTHAILKSY